MFKLYDYQLDAIDKMKNGCILCGGVGSGKSLTAIGYYWLEMKGSRAFLMGESPTRTYRMYKPIDLYIITTARKRDTFEWEKELAHFRLYPNEYNFYDNKVVIDSWNNIEKYKDVRNSFFIFDEQRVVGYGKWSKTFIEIARNNKWILLSATPGDKWEDYMSVFIANGFYKHKTDFYNQHVVMSYISKYPKIERYLNTGRLIRLRNSILIDMDFNRETVQHHEDVYVKYDIDLYKNTIRNRRNIFNEMKPIKNASEFCQCLRRIVNADTHRQMIFLEILEDHPKMIVFYNYDYELDILRSLLEPIEEVEVAEWNGHKHQEIPTSESWVYLVQYTAGAEGWNCISTDTIVFYSQNYSYKMTQQACGRIDRLNTPYRDLYFYHLKSRSGIDLAISQALSKKKKFNEQAFYDKKINKAD